jgi:hypothetical protein
VYLSFQLDSAGYSRVQLATTGYRWVQPHTRAAAAGDLTASRLAVYEVRTVRWLSNYTILKDSLMGLWLLWSVIILIIFNHACSMICHEE